MPVFLRNELIIFVIVAVVVMAIGILTAGKKRTKLSKRDMIHKEMLEGRLPLPTKKRAQLRFVYWLQDIGYHAEAASYAYEWGIMDAKTKAAYEAHLKLKEAEKVLDQAKQNADEIQKDSGK